MCVRVCGCGCGWIRGEVCDGEHVRGGGEDVV